MKVIDSHIHLDHYQDHEIECIVKDSLVEALISGSFNLFSCKRNLDLSKKYSKVKPAFGYHPEQPLPSKELTMELLSWIENHSDETIAIGEVGLPYYLRLEQKLSQNQYQQYLDLLEAFIQVAKRWDKPIVLHAIYDDAPCVCDLLEKHSVSKAHFHWFKGDKKTSSRMIENGYFISISPEVVYKEKIQKLVASYPLDQIMIETDGPWPYVGPFSGEITHPKMMQKSIKMIADIKGLKKDLVGEKLLKNTKSFYHIDQNS